MNEEMSEILQIPNFKSLLYVSSCKALTIKGEVSSVWNCQNTLKTIKKTEYHFKNTPKTVFDVCLCFTALIHNVS